MSELIVLGLIPGTKIQITFILWVLLVVSIVIGCLVTAMRRTHLLRDWVVTVSLFMLTRQTIARP